MKYLTPTEAGAAHDCSARRIQVLAKAKRIPGAKRLGSGAWLIPAEFKVLPPPKRKRRMDKLEAK